MHARFFEEAAREWFAVQVWSGREQATAQHLLQRGYEIFLPCYRDQRRWSDRIKVVERALFAGYIFCRIGHEVVGRLLTAPGVIRLVGDGNHPLPVSTHEIEAIQRIVGTRLTKEPWELVREGQRVRVEHGPLRGIEGVVLVVKDRRRLVVSVELLQRAVAVELDSAWVDVAPSAIAAV